MNDFDEARQRHEASRQAKDEAIKLEASYRKYLIRIGPDTTGGDLVLLLNAEDVELAMDFLDRVRRPSAKTRNPLKFVHGTRDEHRIFSRPKPGQAYRIGHVELPYVSDACGAFDLYLCSDKLLRVGRKSGAFKLEHCLLIGCIPDGTTLRHFSRYQAADYGNSYHKESLKSVLMTYM